VIEPVNRPPPNYGPFFIYFTDFNSVSEVY